MSDRPYHVLFLCTHNSARSVIAECVMNRLGKGRFIAYSAGSQPRGSIHPAGAGDCSSASTTRPSGLRSKSWQEFAGPDAPQLDFVFTVCDDAAEEVCPVWPGQPMSAHWGLADPSRAEGSEAERALAFADTHRMLNQRISIFCSLPLASIDRLSLQRHLDAIGRGQGRGAAREGVRPCATLILGAAARRGGARHGAAARDGDRLRHHGRAPGGRQRGAGAARQHAPDRRDPGRAHHHAGADLGRAFQSGGDGRVRAARRDRARPRRWPTSRAQVLGAVLGVHGGASHVRGERAADLDQGARRAGAVVCRVGGGVRPGA